MSDIGKQALKTKINSKVYENSSQAITGAAMNEVLQDMVDTLCDGANLDAGSVTDSRLQNPVSVSQNTSTGGLDLNIGVREYDIPSADSVYGSIGKEGYYLNSDGEEIAESNYGISTYIPVQPNTTYKWFCEGSYSAQVKACVYNAQKVKIDYFSRASSGVSVSTGANGYYIRVTFGLGFSGNSLKQGDTIIWQPSDSLQKQIDNLSESITNVEKETSFYNVSENVPLESGYYTLATAIAAVPQKMKKGGLVITFRTATGWKFYRYGESKYTNETNWNNTSYWYKIISKQLFCANEFAINFDLVNKKLITNAYRDTTLICEGGTYTIPRGSEISISSSYSNYAIIFNANNNTFNTESISTTLLDNNKYLFAFVCGNTVICPATSRYNVNGNPVTIDFVSKGDFGYIANYLPAEFDLTAKTLTFPALANTTKVYANGRNGYFSNGFTINLADSDVEGVIVYDFADNTFKSYVRNSAYAAPATSVLVGCYDLSRGLAYLNGRFTIKGQHDYWDYADLPTYIKDGISAHIAKVCQGVENADLVFDFITDVQSNFLYEGSRICYIEAINAGMKVGKFVVNGGDFVSGLPTATEDINNMSQMYAAHKRGIGAKDLFMCQGNHDGTWQKWNSTSHQCKAKDVVTDKAWTNMFLKNIDGAVYDAANPLGGYLYKDYEDRKVRVIILNTCDICVYDNDGYLKYNAMYDNAIRQQQLDWLVNYALDFTDKGADKTNWGIIVFTHFGVDVDNDWFPHGASLVEDVLQAFKSGTAITQSSDLGDADFQLVVNHDFSAQGAMNYIAYIHGHTHTDRVLFNNGVPHIATASANGYYNNETPPVGGDCPTREVNSLSYFCWDTMQYDKTNSKMIAYRFGAGADRHINLGINSVAVGETITLTTSLSGTITWTIYAKSGANIASISSNGVVTGIASGNATACAEDENGVKEFFSIVVS